MRLVISNTKGKIKCPVFVSTRAAPGSSVYTGPTPTSDDIPSEFATWVLAHE